MGTSDHKDRPSSIDARLTLIEAELAAARSDARRWRTGTMVLGGIAVVGGLAAAVQVARVEDVIRVRRLEVVGEGDKVVMLAQAAADGGQLDVWSKGGTNVVRLASNPDGGDVAVWSAAGKSVGGLFATPLGGRIEIGDVDGNTLATFARGEEGGALVLNGAGQKASSLRAEAGAAGAVISMRRSDGEIGMLAGVAQDASVLSMRNQAGKEIVFAGGSADQTGTLRIADAAGNECGALLASGGGHLRIKDGAGAVAASVGSAGAGKGGAFEVLNGSGAAALLMDTKDDGGGRFMVGTSTGAPAFIAEANGTAGTLSAYMQERRVAAIGGGKSGGLMNLLDNAGQPIVVVGAAVDGDGGALSVRNSRGVQIGRLGVDAAGAGELAVYNATATVKKLIEAPVPPAAK